MVQHYNLWFNQGGLDNTVCIAIAQGDVKMRHFYCQIIPLDHPSNLIANDLPNHPTAVDRNGQPDDMLAVRGGSDERVCEVVEMILYR